MTVRLAGVLMVVVTLLVMTWMAVDDADDSEWSDLSDSQPARPTEAPVVPHRGNAQDRRREERPGGSADDRTAPPHGTDGPVLEVVIRVDRDGKKLVDQPLDVQAEYLGTLRIVDLQTTPGPLDRPDFAADVTARTASGRILPLPVSKPGAYRLRARLSGTETWHAWDQNTRQGLVRESIHLVSRLRVHIASPQPEAVRSVFANLGGSGEPRSFARDLGNGIWEFENPATLPVEVGAELRGYDVVFYTRVRTNDAVISLGRLVPRTLKIEDAWSGAPILDAKVEVRFAQTRATLRSAGDGRVQIPYPRDPLELMSRFFPYTLRVVAEGYASARIGNLDALHGVSRGLPTIRLLREGSPGGGLLSETGAPARGTRVYLVNGFSTAASGVCDEEGRFVLRAGGLGPNVGVLDDPSGNSLSGRPSRGAFLYLVDSMGAEGLLGPVDWLQLAKGTWMGRLSRCPSWIVDVRRASDDGPVVGAALRRIPLAAGQPVRWLAKEIPPGRTDSQGRCAFGESLGGLWRLEVAAPGFSNATFDVNPTQTPTSVVRLRRGGEISLHLVDRSGKPMAGVKVTLRARETADVASTSDEQGRMTFRVDPSKRYLWFVVNSDLKPAMAAPLYLEPGKGEYVIRLVGREEVVVTLQSGEGEPIDKGVLLIRSPEDRDRVRVAVRTPFMKTVELPRERLEIRAVAAGFNATDWTTIDVAELNEPFQVSWVLPDGFTVRGAWGPSASQGGDGIVVGLEPERIAGFEGVSRRPHPYEIRMFERTAVLDGAGFSFPRVSAGRYRLKVTHNGHVELERGIRVARDLDLGNLAR
ncbi:MAG TPA: carboxypeptidase regulatory-like domain-containing protein [Planctomycetes bacterium]|nr:carboxypeptidase regulatory-like domain-containing protein [Planctomycetota bacterium]